VSAPFSKRHGFTRQRIIARDSAPKQLRSDILFAIKDLMYGDRALVRKDLMQGNHALVRPRFSQNLFDSLAPILKRSSFGLEYREFDRELMGCPWFRFYDCVEATHELLTANFGITHPRRIQEFEEQVNEAFEQNGVGWKLIEGQLQIRGDEGFEQSFQSALKSLGSGGLRNAASEMREALNALSRRPNADATGAIQHAMASLESVARERVGNRKPTLGKLIPKLGLRPPLDTAVEKLWGYASDSARHGKEGKTPGRREATLVVGTCAAVAAFLSDVDE
jgi:hypothetical protein